jgi:hypothetical protein
MALQVVVDASDSDGWPPTETLTSNPEATSKRENVDTATSRVITLPEPRTLVRLHEADTAASTTNKNATSTIRTARIGASFRQDHEPQTTSTITKLTLTPAEHGRSTGPAKRSADRKCPPPPFSQQAGTGQEKTSPARVMDQAAG